MAELLCGYKVIRLESVDSTSDYLKREFLSGSINGPCVAVAKTQSAGRGRIGNRSFYSPSGGLYFSVIKSGEHVKCSHSLITVAAAVAVSSAIEAFCGCNCAVKWVNDVLINGKKVCGILCENVICGKMQAYITGIGVNTDKSAINGFMPEKAGALPISIDNELLMREILMRLNAVFEDEANSFVHEYDSRLNISGKTVNVLKGGKTLTGRVEGVSENGLSVKGENGESFFVATADEIIISPNTDCN